MALTTENKKGNRLSLLLSYKFTFIYFLFLLVLAFRPNDYIYSSSLVLNCIIILFITNLIARISFCWLKATLYTILIYTIFVSAFFAILYKSWLWTDHVLAILSTDKNEASQMFLTFILPGALILICTTSLILLAGRELNKRKHPSTLTSLIIVLLFSLLFFPWKVEEKTSKITFLHIYSSATNTATFANQVAPILYGSSISTYAGMKEYYQRIEALKNLDNKQNPPGIDYQDSISGIKRVIMILGESSSLAHYSLYGYKIKTTPFLDSLRDNNVTQMSYYKGITPIPNTVLAVSRIMSFATLEDLNLSYNTKSIIDVANDAGYTTHWVSGESNTYLKNILAGAHYEYNLRKNPSDVVLDINLTSKLKEIYKREERQFIVLHLQGSHMSYISRRDDIDIKAVGGNYKNINNFIDYDLSIHHTDRTLKSIYNIIKEDDSTIMIYAPDHGEIVNIGHGFNHDFAVQYEVPYIIFNFSPYNPQKTVNRFLDKENNRVNLMTNSYMLAEFMGYRTTEEKQKYLIDTQTSRIIMPGGSIVEYNSVKDK